MIKRESSRKGVHFNVLDALIIILLVAVVLGIYFRFNFVEAFGAKQGTEAYNVSFSVENIRYTTPSYVNVGDEVYFGDTGDLFGVLVSESENKNVLSITPASETFVDSAGNVQEVYYENETRVDAKGRIECQGTYSNDAGFCVGGTRYLAPGQTVEINTELVTFVITITSIDKAE